jgi:hypothetical protein
MTPEGKVKKQVKSILDALDIYHFSPATGGYGASGVPDIIACFKGHFVAIECKAGKNSVTLLQQRNLDQINRAGGLAVVVNEGNIQDLGDILKTLA